MHPTSKTQGVDYYRSIHGWFDFEEVYADAVNRAPEDQHSIFVEVGSWMGKSACFMAQRIKESRKPIKFHCVDNFEGSEEGAEDGRLRKFLRRSKIDLREQFQNNIRNGGYDDIVHLVVNSSVNAAKLFPPASVDFVFLDAGHDYPSIYEDIQAWLPLIKSNGTIGGHDFCALTPGVQMAVEECFPSFEIKGNSWVKTL